MVGPESANPCVHAMSSTGPQVGQLPRQRAQRGADLEAGEGRAEAVPRAAPEGQVRVGGAVGVEPVGIGEDARVAVGGLEPDEH